MDPDEVITKLHEAVSAVQANVMTFETACTETGREAETVQESYREKSEKLMEELTNLETNNDALIETVKTSAIEKCDEADDEINKFISEYTTDIENDIATELEVLTTSFSTAKDETVNFIGSKTKEIDTMTSNYNDLGTKYGESLTSNLEKIKEVDGKVQEELTAFTQKISSEIEVGHDQVLKGFKELIDNTVDTDLSNVFEDKEASFDQFSDDLKSELETISESTSEMLSGLSKELMDTVEEKATEEVKNTIDGMIDKSVNELTEIVTESVVKSTVGVSVTSATSPYMPQLIAFNKIFSALEGAIKAFKTFKMGF